MKFSKCVYPCCSMATISTILLLASYYSIAQIDHIFFIHSFICFGYLSCFQVKATMTNAVTNICTPACCCFKDKVSCSSGWSQILYVYPWTLDLLTQYYGMLGVRIQGFHQWNYSPNSAGLCLFDLSSNHTFVVCLDITLVFGEALLYIPGCLQISRVGSRRIAAKVGHHAGLSWASFRNWPPV